MRLINITTCLQHFFYCEAMSIIHASYHEHNSCMVKNPLLIRPFLSHCYYIGHNFMVGCGIMWNRCEVQYCITQAQTAHYAVPECTTAVYVL
jgi:hypothetical protein